MPVESYEQPHWPGLLRLALVIVLTVIVGVASFAIVGTIGAPRGGPHSVQVVSRDSSFDAQHIKAEVEKTQWDYPVHILIYIGTPPRTNATGSRSSIGLVKDAYPAVASQRYGVIVFANPSTGEVAFWQGAGLKHQSPSAVKAVEETLSYQAICGDLDDRRVSDALRDYSHVNNHYVGLSFTRHILVAIVIALLTVPLSLLATKALIQSIFLRARGGRFAHMSRRGRRAIVATVRSIYNRATLSYDDLAMEGSIHKALAKPFELWQRHYIDLARHMSAVYDLTDKELTSLSQVRTLETLYDSAQRVQTVMDAIVDDGKRLRQSLDATLHNDVYQMPERGGTDRRLPLGHEYFNPRPPTPEPSIADNLKATVLSDRGDYTAAQRRQKIRFAIALPPLYIALGLVAAVIVGLVAMWIVGRGFTSHPATTAIEAGFSYGLLALIVIFIPGSLLVIFLRNRQFNARQEAYVKRIFTSVVMSDEPLQLEMMLLARDYPDYRHHALRRQRLWKETITYMSDVSGFGDDTRDISDTETYALARFCGLQMRSLFRTRALLENDAPAWQAELHLLVCVSGKELSAFPGIPQIATNLGDSSYMSGLDRLEAVEALSADVVEVGLARSTWNSVANVEQLADHLIVSGGIAAQEAFEHREGVVAPSQFSFSVKRGWFLYGQRHGVRPISFIAVGVVIVAMISSAVVDVQPTKPLTSDFAFSSQAHHVPNTVEVIDPAGVFDDAVVYRATTRTPLPYPFRLLVTSQCDDGLPASLGKTWLTGTTGTSGTLPLSRIQPRAIVICVTDTKIETYTGSSVVRSTLVTRSYTDATAELDDILSHSQQPLVKFSVRYIKGGHNRPE